MTGREALPIPDRVRANSRSDARKDQISGSLGRRVQRPRAAEVAALPSHSPVDVVANRSHPVDERPALGRGERENERAE